MTEKTNFFRVFLGLFTRNWGLKIISLLLAILVYHALKKPSNGQKHAPTQPTLLQHQPQHDRDIF